MFILSNTTAEIFPEYFYYMLWIRFRDGCHTDIIDSALAHLCCLMAYEYRISSRRFYDNTNDQRTCGAMITSLLHQNDVTTSFWRNNDVIIALSFRWIPKSRDSAAPRPSWTVTVLENSGVVLGHSLNHISCLDAYYKSFSFIPNLYRHKSAKNSLKVACVVTVRDVQRESGFVNMIPWPYTVNRVTRHALKTTVDPHRNTHSIKNREIK